MNCQELRLQVVKINRPISEHLKRQLSPLDDLALESSRVQSSRVESSRHYSPKKRPITVSRVVVHLGLVHLLVVLLPGPLLRRLRRIAGRVHAGVPEE